MHLIPAGATNTVQKVCAMDVINAGTDQLDLLLEQFLHKPRMPLPSTPMYFG